MRRLFQLAVMLTLVGLLVVSAPASLAQPDLFVWWLAVTDARLRAGAPPCELSSTLSAAAQQHAEDLAAHMFVSHIGSNGSTPEQRISEAGYFAWTDAQGKPFIGEVVWGGSDDANEAIAALLASPAEREVLINRLYREIGIGVATDSTGRSYWVLNFGARPNVLPVFINDGAYSTTNALVAIHLTNEEVRPEGQGVAIGRVIEVRIANEPKWDELPWQPWEELLPWTLPATEGEHTVYVQLRDAAGRTVTAADSIYFGEIAAPRVVPLVLTPRATLPSEDHTGESGAPVSTPESAPATATLMPAEWTVMTPFPTWTPLPTTPPSNPGERPRLPIGLVVTLEGVAILLGLFLMLRRSQR